MYIWLGRIFVGAATGSFGYLIMSQGNYQVNQPVYAVVVFSIIGFFIGSIFLTLFGHVSDSIVIVYILDSEI